MIRTIVTWFILAAPAAILLADWAVYRCDGYDATITAIVRGWAEKSAWPEFVFLAGVVLLYSHLFRNWP